jgi:hypothetical protein
MEMRKNIFVAGFVPASLLMDGAGRNAGQVPGRDIEAVGPYRLLSDSGNRHVGVFV